MDYVDFIYYKWLGDKMAGKTNLDFEEEHTGLADAIVESQILARCFKSHKKIDKKINRACWRIPQTLTA